MRDNDDNEALLPNPAPAPAAQKPQFAPQQRLHADFCGLPFNHKGDCGPEPTQCTCGHLEHTDTGECKTCGTFCGPVSNAVGQADLQSWAAPAAQKLHWPLTAKHPNCAGCDREYEPPHENCGECERDAAPATEAASPPEKLMTDAEWAALSAESRFRINQYFSASRPAPEQARRNAEKAGKNCVKWLQDNGIVSDNPRPGMEAEIAAIILSAGVAAPEQGQYERIEWLFRKKLAADCSTKARDWLTNYELMTSGSEGQRVASDTKSLYSNTAELIGEMVRAIDTLGLQPVSAAPQGDFRAGVAACVERVKVMAMPRGLSESGEEIVRHFKQRIVAHLESLTDSAAAPPVCEFCDHPTGFFPAAPEFGKFIHRGRDNEAEPCTAPERKCPKCGKTKTSPECWNCEFAEVSAAAPAAQQEEDVDFLTCSTCFKTFPDTDPHNDCQGRAQEQEVNSGEPK